jgi:hypothetical protein
VVVLVQLWVVELVLVSVESLVLQWVAESVLASAD